MKNRDVARLIIAVSFLLGLALLSIPAYLVASFYNSTSVPDAPASTNSPPVYPGADDVRSREEREFPGTQIQIVSFQTKDEPDTVITFYRDALTKDGWKEQTATQFLQSYHYIHVGGGGMDSDPEFTLSLETTTVSSSKTGVELVLVRYPSR
jgi:hypothetical protein